MIELHEKKIEQRIEGIDKRLRFLEAQIETIYRHLGIKKVEEDE